MGGGITSGRGAGGAAQEVRARTVLVKIIPVALNIFGFLISFLSLAGQEVKT